MNDDTRILDLLARGPIRTSLIAATLGLTPQTLRATLRQMRLAGLTRRLSDNRVAHAGYRTIHERFRAGLVPPTEPHRPSPRPVRVIDGQAYEIFSLDDLQQAKAKHWPTRGCASFTPH